MRKHLIAIAILAGFGVVVSSYGLWQHYAPLGAAFCNVSETFSCDIVNKSAYSEIAGIPVALIGIVGYAALGMLAASLAFRRHSDTTQPLNHSTTQLLFVLSLLGLAFQAVYTVIELWWIGAYCPICIASQAIILAIVILAFIVLRNRASKGKSQFETVVPNCDSSTTMSQPPIGTLTCPQCGATQQAEIPTSSCQHSYVCNACGKTIASAPNDCCVFCTYGDRKCPVATGESVSQ